MNFKPRSTSKIAAVASSVALIAALGLSGCSVNIGNTTEKANQYSKDNSSNPKIQEQYDLMFAQMMIPHHQQAVDMGTLAETRASSMAVKELAAKIKSEQSPEITLMQGWVDAASKSGGGMGMHDMPMNGMLTDQQLKELKAASGTAFDKLYLTDMIAHHEGTVQMAKLAAKSGSPRLVKLGKAIVESQTAEIKYMKSLLAK